MDLFIIMPIKCSKYKSNEMKDFLVNSLASFPLEYNYFSYTDRNDSLNEEDLV